jgi:hypothetical protein
MPSVRDCSTRIPLIEVADVGLGSQELQADGPFL